MIRYNASRITEATLCAAAEIKTEAGLDGDLLPQEAAHVVAALHAVHSQNTPENALLMTGLQRLSSLAQDLKIEVAPLLEYAAQVLSHSDLCVVHWRPCWHVMHACLVTLNACARVHGANMLVCMFCRVRAQWLPFVSTPGLL